MINFACKVFSNNQVLRCSFGLNETELNTLKELIKKESSTNDLSEALKKHKSVIQRGIKKLLKNKLITRRQVNLQKGYEYYYKAISKEELKNRANNSFKLFNETVNKTINDW